MKRLLAILFLFVLAAPAPAQMTLFGRGLHSLPLITVGGGGSTNWGLLDLYDYNEGTGSHTYSTIYGTNVDGSLLSGPTWTNGLTDGALQLASVGGSAVAFNNATNISKVFPLTLGYRIRPTATLTDGETVFASDAIAPNYAGFWSQINSNGSITAGFGDNTGATSSGYRIATTTNTGLVSLGNWQNVAILFGGLSNISIYAGGTNYPVTYAGTGGSSPVYTYAGQGNGFILNGTPTADLIVDKVAVYSNLMDSAAVLTNWGPILTGFPAWTNLVLSSSNLVALYPMNETSGTVMHDASPNALNGIFTNITALGQSGVTNGFFSAQFTPASLSLGIVTDTAKLDITGALTLAVWAKHTGSFTANQGMISKYIGDSPANNRSYALYCDANGYVNFTISTDGTFTGATSLTYSSVTDTNWHYWGAVYVPSTSMTIYKDGLAVTNKTTSVPASIYSGAADLTAGTQFSKTTSSDIWGGYLGPIVIWSTNQSSTTLSNQNWQATHP